MSMKVLTYYGNAKQRKELRTGWTKLNNFHVCITSYQLAVQDATSFRRKKARKTGDRGGMICTIMSANVRRIFFCFEVFFPFIFDGEDER